MILATVNMLQAAIVRIPLDFITDEQAKHDDAGQDDAEKLQV